MSTSRKRVKTPVEQGFWAGRYKSLWEVLKCCLASNADLLEQRSKLLELVKADDDKYLYIRAHEDLNFEMKVNSDVKDKRIAFMDAKFGIKTELMKEDAALLKLKSDYLEEDLADARLAIDYLSSRCSQRNFQSECPAGRRNDSEELPLPEDSIRRKMRKLKEDHAQLTSETASLVREKDFVWQQYNLMQRDLSDRLSSKQIELDQSNEKISQLISTMEGLQSSITVKDDEIVRLKTQLVEMETVAERWKNKVSELSTSLENTANGTQAVPPPSSKEQSRNQSIKKIFKMNYELRTPPSAAPTRPSAQGHKGGSKRKRSDFNTPKLFSTTFKVPKLKVLDPV